MTFSFPSAICLLETETIFTDPLRAIVVFSETGANSLLIVTLSGFVEFCSLLEDVQIVVSTRFWTVLRDALDFFKHPAALSASSDIITRKGKTQRRPGAYPGPQIIQIPIIPVLEYHQEQT